MASIPYYILAVLVLIMVVKIFSWPIRVLIKLLLNGFLGYILLLLLNFLGKSIGIYVPVNAISSLIAGFFGVPGVIFLIIFNKFL